MSKIEYLIWQYDTSLHLYYSLKRKLRNNIVSLTTLRVIMKYMSRPKSTAVKDIDIADILGYKYRYRIDHIGHGDINPPLVNMIR